MRTLQNKITGFAVILLASTLLAACGAKQNGVKKGTRAADQRASAAAGVSNTTFNAQWGVMVATLRPDDYNKSVAIQNAFQTAVSAFMEATLDPSFIGTISGDPSKLAGSTGVRFWGNVEVNGNVINKTNAKLRISIWDSFAGQKDEKGNVIPEFPVYFETLQSESNVNGITTLTFEDKYSTFFLEGKIANGTFSGYAGFKNKVDVLNRAPWQSKPYMAAFTVPACGFFKGLADCPK